MEVFAALGDEVVNDVDAYALAGLAGGKGDAAGGGCVVGPCGGRGICGAVGHAESGGCSLAQDQVKRGDAGFFIDHHIAHRQESLLAVVDGAVGVGVGHLGVVVNDGGRGIGVGNRHSRARCVFGVAQLQEERLGVLGQHIVGDGHAHGLGGDAGGKGQRAKDRRVVAVGGGVFGGAIAGAIADRDGAGGWGAQAYDELGVETGFVNDEVGNRQKIGHGDFLGEMEFF